MATFTNRIILKGQDKTKGAFGSVRRSINNVGKAVAGFSVISAGVFAVLGKQAFEAADRIGKLAKSTGASTEFLSEMAHAAKLSGTNLESFAKGTQQLQRNVVQANEGLATYTRAFERVGISSEELKGLQPEVIFDRVADAIAGIEDPSIKTATAMDIFGRAGKDLIPLLNEGSAGIAKMRAQAKALGLSLSKDQTDGAEAANDAIEKLTAGVRGATNTLALQFAPTIQAVAEFLATKVPLSIKQAQAAFVILRKALVDSITGILQVMRLVSVIPGPFGNAVQLQLAALGDVNQMIKTLKEQSEGYSKEIDDLIEGIGRLSFELNSLVPNGDGAAASIQEIAINSIPAKKNIEALETALEMQLETEITLNKMKSDRTNAMLALNKAVNEAVIATDEETEALRRQEEQARATAQAFNQLFSAVGSLNQTFGLGLNSIQGAVIADIFADAGVNPQILDAIAVGAQGGSSFEGQLLGAAGGGLGMALGGPIGAAIGSWIGQTVGDFLDNLWGGGGLQNSEFVFGGQSQGGSPIDINTPFGAALLRGGGSEFRDTFQGPAAQALEGFFGIIEDVLTSDQIEAAALALAGQSFVVRPEDVESGRFLEPILDTIVSAMSPAVQRFVRQFDGIEAQLEAFAAINLTMQVLEADPIQLWADALADADRTAIQVLRDLSEETARLGETAFDSVEDMIAFGESVQAFNRNFVQFMAGLEQASRNISASTESTIQGLRFSALEGNPADQFEFLTRRANQLGAGIGDLSSAAEIERTIAMIQQLLTQAFGIATPEQRQELLPAFEATLRSAEEEGQARIDEMRAEAEAMAEERREQNQMFIDAATASATAVTDASNVIAFGGGQIVNAAEKVEAGGNAILAGANVIAQFPFLQASGFEVTG